MKEYKTLLAGKWVLLNDVIEVKNKLTGEVIGTVPKAKEKDVELAVNTSERAFNDFRKWPSYKRAEILEKTANFINVEKEKFAEMLALEVGKAWKFAIGEVERAIETFTFAAEEAKKIHGETVPMDASPTGVNRIGYYYRVPVGVVAVRGSSPPQEIKMKTEKTKRCCMILLTKNREKKKGGRKEEMRRRR